MVWSDTSRPRRWLLIICTALLAISGGAVLYYNDPSDTPWMPRCFFHAITGWDCPSCGSTRALYCLLHGDWSAAVAYNPFILISWPLLALMVGVWTFFPRQRTSRWLWWLLLGYIIASIAWCIIRNLT